MRIANKKRFILSVLCLIILLASIALSLNSIFDKRKSYDNYDVVNVKVRNGDTVWKIAENVVEYDENIREKVGDIHDLNNMRYNEVIVPGQVILVPVAKRAMQAHQ